MIMTVAKSKRLRRKLKTVIYSSPPIRGGASFFESVAPKTLSTKDFLLKITGKDITISPILANDKLIFASGLHPWRRYLSEVKTARPYGNIATVPNLKRRSGRTVALPYPALE